ncbi:MAG: hypothetical protein HY852_12070 [Bradyrhizobium sp.]|uniref:hypothetical protein n=1 Tax=Bradyrhizobium sp. TaxID=376 RepID=UPI0025C2E780|nr:hypothetical protein [Bradyrhizobium sp.]MBI5262540.1 hypothetical protein [Bradyrhizobium sp.]
MGTIIEFPVSRRLGSPEDASLLAEEATVVILPVIRIERETDETSGDSGPEQGTAHGRRRRRR